MIGDDRIRLLDILPGGPDDPICARLFSVSLSESPAYEALSYTWGDLSRVKEIQVSHESSKEEGTSSSSTSIVPTWVTSNCYAALRRLRQGATDRSRTVWIYSICINQANIDEKNHQLTLMKRIYEKASCVIVYLGEHADDSDKAMDWIQEIDTPSGYASTSGDETELLDLNLDKSIMEALFRRPWFRRVWVLQEVWVAKKAVVYCGDRSVSWDSFRAFYHWNVSCHLIDELPYVVKSGPGRFPYLTFVEKLMHELRDTSNCEASDERDKLYAILPLIQQSNIEGDA